MGLGWFFLARFTSPVVWQGGAAHWAPSAERGHAGAVPPGAEGLQAHGAGQGARHVQAQAQTWPWPRPLLPAQPLWCIEPFCDTKRLSGQSRLRPVASKQKPLSHMDNVGYPWGEGTPLLHLHTSLSISISCGQKPAWAAPAAGGFLVRSREMLAYELQVGWGERPQLRGSVHPRHPSWQDPGNEIHLGLPNGMRYHSLEYFSRRCL